MKATAFLLSLFLLLFGGNTMNAGAVSHNPELSFSRTQAPGIFQHQAVLENTGSENGFSFFLHEDFDDEDEKTSLVKEQYKSLTASINFQPLHNYYNAPKPTARSCANTSTNRYILLRTLRI